MERKRTMRCKKSVFYCILCAAAALLLFTGCTDRQPVGTSQAGTEKNGEIQSGDALSVRGSLPGAAVTDESTAASGGGTRASGKEQPQVLSGTERQGGQAPETKKSGLLFWKVTDGQGHKLYLFGSVHRAEKSLYPLPKSILAAYQSADSLAVEYDAYAYSDDKEAQEQNARHLIIQDGSLVQNHIPWSLYKKAKSELNRHGVYRIEYEKMKPIAWALMLNSLNAKPDGLASQYGVDVYFMSLAKKSGKKIVELENSELPMRTLGSFSDGLQALLLEQAMESGETPLNDSSAMYRLWRTGNAAQVEQYIFQKSTEGIRAQDKKYMEEYFQKMLYSRNGTMADKAEHLLKSGKTGFVVAGTAHMLGDSGVIAKLRTRGYRVEQV